MCVFVGNKNKNKQQQKTLRSIFDNLSIREILAVTSAYARLPARTDFEGGGKNRRGGECGKSRDAFGQPAFF